MANLIDFQVVVQDDRPAFANSQRFPKATVLSQPIHAAVKTLDTVSQLYAVLVTRGYGHDVAALNVLLPRSPHYLGMIGSENRVHTVFQTLQQDGIPGIDSQSLPSRLQAIHAPIGLDIGALTPSEIAVSICAELINVRRGGRGQSLATRSPRSTSLGSGVLSVQRNAQQAQQQ